MTAERSVHAVPSLSKFLFLQRTRWVIVALNVVILGVIAAMTAMSRQGFTGSDGQIYMTAAQRLLHGESVYGFSTSDTGFGFTYPPFAALVFTTFAWFPAAVPLLQGACVLSVYAVVLLTVRRLGAPSESALWLALLVAPLALLWYPVQRSYGSGQVDLLLAVLIVFDALGARSRWRGIAIGVAAAIKLTPAGFILLFLVRKDIPSVLRIMASAAATTALGWIVAPSDSFVYWTKLLWDTDRVGAQTAALNQSLAGLISRLAASSTGHLEGLAWIVWLCACAIVVAFGVRAMRVLDHGRVEEVGPFALNALVVLLISPISWLHHWVLAVVPVLFLVARGWLIKGWDLMLLAAAGVVVLAVPPWWFLGSYLERGGWSVAETLVGSCAVLWAVAVVFLSARRRRPSGVEAA
ncbi:membrane protein [Sinomonas cellulolyticus]|uniref:DUF2029 domain-containing protein n=1 Tax=Sinomonas cellulolyticus TaxID=2801916 RepID=A0ABS1JZQ6_9MICC|nr:MULTISPECIES: glycosyltransferase 87 family protein [Sinomonas]MBL0704698.1 DUF2029 domain-containing protein [Sinomonas cellulolyticus]GHG46523.1 membrane protein [Sinomonas sp. KCTC 49339]